MARIIRRRIYLGGTKRRRKLLLRLQLTQMPPPTAQAPNSDFFFLPKKRKHPLRIRKIHRRGRHSKRLLQDLYLQSRPNTVICPSVVNILLASAEAVLSIAGLGFTITVEPSLIIPANVVISQSPAAGTPVAVGTAIALVVSSGWATIPSEVGNDISQAIADSVALGLIPRTNPKPTSQASPGTVLQQLPFTGDKVLVGSIIFFTYAIAPPPGAPRSELPSTGDIVNVITQVT